VARPPLFMACCTDWSSNVAYANTMHDVSVRVSCKIRSPLVPPGAYNNWMKIRGCLEILNTRTCPKF
jgi:hypothetical protein